jgi:hypothetical protein
MGVNRELRCQGIVMFKTSLAILAYFILCPLALLFADDSLAVLESVSEASRHDQPGLLNYLVNVDSPQFKETMTGDMPADISPPVISKFWQRSGKSMIFTEPDKVSPYAEQIIRQISADLAVELDEIVLPFSRAEQRRQLAKDADLRLSEVLLADNLIKRLEISFAQPTDLAEAFYASGMRLPQKQVRALAFDIDTRTRTVSEFRVVAEDSPQLTVEFRYIEVPGGHIPQRYQITSPDGKIDERFEVKFADVNGFTLPANMLRIIRRPERQERLEIIFKNYRVNQPVSEDIQSRLKGL